MIDIRAAFLFVSARSVGVAKNISMEAKYFALHNNDLNIADLIVGNESNDCILTQQLF